jgi:hypothetical protein
MVNFADTVLSYAQRLAESLCDWPDEDWIGNELEWGTMKKTSAPVAPPGLSSTQVKIIRRATSFGTVAGRPQTDPISAQWCRDRLRRLTRAAKQYGMADLLEPCFDIGYRTASTRRLTPQAAPHGAGQRTGNCSPLHPGARVPAANNSIGIR